jgi:hypothetical protein
LTESFCSPLASSIASVAENAISGVEFAATAIATEEEWNGNKDYLDTNLEALRLEVKPAEEQEEEAMEKQLDVTLRSLLAELYMSFQTNVQRKEQWTKLLFFFQVSLSKASKE